MDKLTVTLVVSFEVPFWIGMFERTYVEDQSSGDEKSMKLSVSKVTFGAEPKDYEVKEYVLKNYDKLRFSPAVDSAAKVIHKNPKRILRDAKRFLNETRVGTKSQQALNQQRELMKTERRLNFREQKEAEEHRKFELKQQKRKEKHRGR